MIPFAAYTAAETPNAFQWARQPQKLPFPWGILTLTWYVVPWPTQVSLPNSIFIGLAVFAGPIYVTNTQTGRPHYVW